MVWWTVRAGISIPLSAGNNIIPINLLLTEAGNRFLSRDDDDHPLVPGFVDRIQTRCAGLPADVVSLLADARTCLDNGATRPAVIIMGVAYEVAIKIVYEALIARNQLPAADLSAARRIAAIRNIIDTILPGTMIQERDDRFATHLAYQFADQLRRRRNDGAHTRPTYGLDDREETEELLISAGRHLPRLWAIR